VQAVLQKNCKNAVILLLKQWFIDAERNYSFHGSPPVYGETQHTAFFDGHVKSYRSFLVEFHVFRERQEQQFLVLVRDVSPFETIDNAVASPINEIIVRC
jgi:hypothetical protein